MIANKEWSIYSFVEKKAKIRILGDWTLYY